MSDQAFGPWPERCECGGPATQDKHREHSGTICSEEGCGCQLSYGLMRSLADDPAAVVNEAQVTRARAKAASDGKVMDDLTWPEALAYIVAESPSRADDPDAVARAADQIEWDTFGIITVDYPETARRVLTAAELPLTATERTP